MAACFKLNGDYDTALEMFERSRAITVSHHGDSHRDVGELLGRISECHRLKGDIAQAEDFLAMSEAVLAVAAME
jgi:hypothetical protein